MIWINRIGKGIFTIKMKDSQVHRRGVDLGLKKNANGTVADIA